MTIIIIIIIIQLRAPQEKRKVKEQATEKLYCRN